MTPLLKTAVLVFNLIAVLILFVFLNVYRNVKDIVGEKRQLRPSHSCFAPRDCPVHGSSFLRMFFGKRSPEKT